MIVDLMGITINGATEAATKEAAQKVIARLCEKCGLDTVHLVDVIFASANHYEAAIRRHNPDENYTNTATYRGFGKTVFIENSNPLQCSVVMRAEFLPAFVSLDAADDLRDSAILMLFHELGHCKDYVARNIEIPSVDPICRRFEPTLNRYAAIFLEEFVADRNVSHFIRVDQFHTRIGEAQTQINDLVQKLDEDLAKFNRQEMSISDFAFLSMYDIWMIVMEVQRLVAFEIGHEDLVLKFNLSGQERVDINRLAEFLHSEFEKLQPSYPNWTADMHSFLKTAFHVTANSLRFEFRNAPEEERDRFVWPT